MNYILFYFCFGQFWNKIFFFFFQNLMIPMKLIGQITFNQIIFKYSEKFKSEATIRDSNVVGLSTKNIFIDFSSRVVYTVPTL